LQLLFILVPIVIASSTSTQYLATIHHSNEEYKQTRSLEESSFVGNLKINNTVNENGEITISLCDITQNLFNSIPSILLFNYDETVGVSNLASAELRASLAAKLNINGCLVFFFNPCCETFGLRIALDNPVLLSATGSLQVELKALSYGGGTNNLGLSPSSNINLGGFSPVIGSWNLPPILDQFVSVSDQALCANLGIPGTNFALKFCVALGNFSAGVSGVNVCPRLTISLGNQKFLDISYTALSDNKLPKCLSLSFLPICTHNGAKVSPDIVQLFKSSDSNNDQKISLLELEKAKALLGIFEPKSTSTASFSKMDSNSNGEVDFVEFDKYTAKQSEVYSQTSESGKQKQSKSFSAAHIAIAVIVTMVGTGLIVAAVLVGVAQRKGVINISWLSKVIKPKASG